VLLDPRGPFYKCDMQNTATLNTWSLKSAGGMAPSYAGLGIVKKKVHIES
jgi:hypothetical protein